MSDPRRSILHADMDAFFVSVELRRRPNLRGRPVVVGGTGRRGVVAAASYEARRYDVHSALPSAIARRRCPHAIFLPGDHAHYSEISRRVRDVFERYTPLVEPLSLDEAFLDVTGSQRLFGPAPQIATRIREDIRDELELDCSVGVAQNKFVAKLASVDAKPRATPSGVRPGVGVVVIDPVDQEDYLDQLPIGRLWGVGAVTWRKLDSIGVATAGDLRRLDEQILRSKLGEAQALHLAALVRGEDDRPVEPDQETKSISHEETYQQDLHTDAELRTELVRLADAVARRLRSQNVGARTLALKLRFSEGFHTISRQTTSPEPTDQADTIVQLLRPLLDAIDPSPGIRLLGVGGSNIGPAHHQLSFDEIEGPEHGAREAAVDEIRERFGSDAIGPASSVRGGEIRNVRRGSQQWGSSG